MPFAFGAASDFILSTAGDDGLFVSFRTKKVIGLYLASPNVQNNASKGNLVEVYL